MAYIHRQKMIDTFARDVRISRAVLRKLRDAGYVAKLCDSRDIHGARLWPVSLECGQVPILCRTIGAHLSATDRDYLASQPLAYVQRGARDISGLLAHLQRYLSTP